MIYLDNASTTRVLDEVVESMLPYLSTYYGNDNSLYYDLALKSKEAVSASRAECSKLIGCISDDIIFTSSSTESNNMIIKGFYFMGVKKGKNKIISTKIEHSSIKETLKFLESLGAKICYVDIDRNGVLNYEQLNEYMDDQTCLVSIMYVNNEMGNIIDIKMIGEMCEKKHIPFHSDFTQAIGKINVDITKIPGLVAVSYSAHKFYGPKGIAVAMIKKDARNEFVPLIHGGEQEFGLRGGTLAVHQIVGMGKAAQICNHNFEQNLNRLMELEKSLTNRLSIVFGDRIRFNNLNMEKVPGVISCRILGINNQVFLKNFSQDLAASSGSACSALSPSYVLKEMGFSEHEISETIRFTLSPYDNYDDFKIIE